MFVHVHFSVSMVSFIHFQMYNVALPIIRTRVSYIIKIVRVRGIKAGLCVYGSFVLTRGVRR